jgi:hypothetical protein
MKALRGIGRQYLGAIGGYNNYTGLAGHCILSGAAILLFYNKGRN